MSKRMKTMVVGLLVLVLIAGIVAYAGRVRGDEAPTSVERLGYPAVDGAAETEINSGMPVPGLEGVEETEVIIEGSEDVGEAVVSSGMPVPGFEGVDEMIVNQD